MKNGLQLFNFRKELTEDYKGTLREIAKLGFDGVEFAILYGDMEPAELLAFMKELKLECAGTMFAAADLLERDNIAYEYAKVLNSPAVTTSTSTASDFNEVWQEINERCRNIGANAASHGCVFSYHNHWSEFTDIDGIPAMYRIMDDNDPKSVFMEPDVCWVTRGGYAPADFIRRYSGRIRQVHLKDSKAPEDHQQLTELGNGIIDIKGSFAAAKEAGAQWVIYEQDVTDDPFRSAEISLAYLKKLQRGEI